MYGHVRAAAVAASLVLVAGGPLRGDEPPPAEPGARDDERAPKRKRAAGGRELDPEAPAAKALDALLHVPHAYAKDGTVRLSYTFDAAEQLEDWEAAGFDRAEEVGPRGGRKRRGAGRSRRLAIGAGSQRPGRLLHRLSLGDAWEVRVTGRITRMAPSTELVLFVGKAGVRFGTQFVGRTARGFAPLEGAEEPDREPFDRGQTFALGLRCSGGTVSATLDGKVVATTARFDEEATAGRVGLYAQNLMLVVDAITIEGRVDPSKL